MSATIRSLLERGREGEGERERKRARENERERERGRERERESDRQPQTLNPSTEYHNTNAKYRTAELLCGFLLGMCSLGWGGFHSSVAAVDLRAL